MPDVQWSAIDALKPNPRNARTHSKKQIRQIADSIAAFGFVVPILIDEARNIIAGHGRYEAAKLLGLKQVPVIVVQGLSEAKRRALALADNKIAENAGWDREMLAVELAGIVGASHRGRSRYLRSPGSPRPRLISSRRTSRKTRPIPLTPSIPHGAPLRLVTKLGDLWQLGHHRLLCGDARSESDLARLMGGSQAAMAFMDPPYNVRDP